jgi:hypothetical protein
MIWFGSFFQALTLGHTSRPLAGLRILFWVPLGVPKWPKTVKKNYFLVVLDHFSYKNRPNDLVRGLFSSSDIEPYIPPTCGPLSTFLGPFWGAQMAKNSIK